MKISPCIYLVSRFHSNTKSFLTCIPLPSLPSLFCVHCPPSHHPNQAPAYGHCCNKRLFGKLGGKHLLLSLVRVGTVSVCKQIYVSFLLETFQFPIPMPKISSHHFIAINVPRWESVHFHGSSSRGHSASIFSMGISGNGQSSTRKGKRRAERLNLVPKSSIQVGQSHHHCHSS